ncbi:MAG: glycosyltransferase family A protein [Planctomycetota bacterium]|nr:glycosyltransferase family A protein [Planctomycetota bacterium]
MAAQVDILMITYNRPEYTRLALPQLLRTADENTRIWLWHNGTHEETLAVVKEHASHPRVAKFHHSPENAMLRTPTNWFWNESKGEYLGKVDDDCLMPEGWVQTLVRAHEAAPKLGVVGCWPFLEEDFRPKLAERKIREVAPGVRVLTNCWIGGSGYLFKRSQQQRFGVLGDKEAFTGYCLRMARTGIVNGWLMPFLYMDHMDDPRSPHTMMVSEEAFAKNPSLSSRRFGTPSLEALKQRAVQAAIEVQSASSNPSDYIGLRASIRRAVRRLMGKGRIAKLNP